MQGEVRLFPEPLRSIAFGSIGSSFNTVGSPFAHPIYITHLVNDTDVALVFSWNGVDQHLYLPSGGFLVLDITANKAGYASGLFFSVGQRIYVAEAFTPPTSGIVTLSAFFAL